MVIKRTPLYFVGVLVILVGFAIFTIPFLMNSETAKGTMIRIYLQKEKVEKQLKRNEHINSVPKYIFEYRYGQKTYEFKTETEKQYYKGDTEEIRFIPNDPDSATFNNFYYVIGPVKLAFITLLLLAWTIFIFFTLEHEITI